MKQPSSVTSSTSRPHATCAPAPRIVCASGCAPARLLLPGGPRVRCAAASARWRHKPARPGGSLRRSPRDQPSRRTNTPWQHRGETGTNGKTTTSGLVTNVLRQTGLRVWRNREGSNLARGIATSLMTHAALSGRLHEQGDAAGVFEVDEAAFPQVVAELRPRTILVTNLFRDQLDRYGRWILSPNAGATRWPGCQARRRCCSTPTCIRGRGAGGCTARWQPRSLLGIEDAPTSEDDARGEYMWLILAPAPGVANFDLHRAFLQPHWPLALPRLGPPGAAPAALSARAGSVSLD